MKAPLGVDKTTPVRYTETRHTKDSSGEVSGFFLKHHLIMLPRKM